MKRLLCLAAAALAIVGWASPAAAQDKKVRAQMGWAFPSSTGLLGPTQTRLVELLRTLSGGSIDVKGFEPGALVPVLLRRFGQDPATASSIILTTVTDVVGFFSFLGIATLWFGFK